jgi:hypothetical protein
MTRFKSIGSSVYEKGDRIGCTPDEAAVELARKLNAYQMRVARLKAEVERLKKQAKGMSEAGWSLVNAHQYDASIFYWNKCINDWQNADKGVQS